MAQSSAKSVVAEVWFLSEGKWLKVYQYLTERGLEKRLHNIAKYSPSLKVLVHRPVQGRWHPVEFHKDKYGPFYEISGRSLGQTSVQNLALKGINC